MRRRSTAHLSSPAHARFRAEQLARRVNTTGAPIDDAASQAVDTVCASALCSSEQKADMVATVVRWWGTTPYPPTDALVGPLAAAAWTCTGTYGTPIPTNAVPDGGGCKLGPPPPPPKSPDQIKCEAGGHVWKNGACVANAVFGVSGEELSCEAIKGTWDGATCTLPGGKPFDPKLACTSLGGSFDDVTGNCALPAGWQPPSPSAACAALGGTWSAAAGCSVTVPGMDQLLAADCAKKGGTWDGKACQPPAKQTPTCDPADCAKLGGTCDAAGTCVITKQAPPSNQQPAPSGGSLLPGLAIAGVAAAILYFTLNPPGRSPRTKKG